MASNTYQGKVALLPSKIRKAFTDAGLGSKIQIVVSSTRCWSEAKRGFEDVNLVMTPAEVNALEPENLGKLLADHRDRGRLKPAVLESGMLVMLKRNIVKSGLNVCLAAQFTEDTKPLVTLCLSIKHLASSNACQDCTAEISGGWGHGGAGHRRVAYGSFDFPNEDIIILPSEQECKSAGLVASKGEYYSLLATAASASASSSLSHSLAPPAPVDSSKKVHEGLNYPTGMMVAARAFAGPADSSVSTLAEQVKKRQGLGTIPNGAVDIRTVVSEAFGVASAEPSSARFLPASLCTLVRTVTTSDRALARASPRTRHASRSCAPCSPCAESTASWCWSATTTARITPSRTTSPRSPLWRTSRRPWRR